MTTLYFECFEDAKNLAKMCAWYFQVEVRMRSSKSGFEVLFESPLQINDSLTFGQHAYVFGPLNKGLLSLLHYVDKAPYVSANNAWQDPGTGLVWDIARLFYGCARTDFPRNCSTLMNALQYGGFEKWRLPSLDELRTLTIEKLSEASPPNANEWGTTYWSSEESLHSGPEKSFLDLRSRSVGHQRYIEQDRNRRTYGDGYTESAQTILVCSY